MTAIPVMTDVPFIMERCSFSIISSTSFAAVLEMDLFSTRARSEANPSGLTGISDTGRPVSLMALSIAVLTQLAAILGSAPAFVTCSR